ncbi:hypothetical protein NQT66_00215 [Cellulophaga baltica]|uniref:hypothetical protein n=1 Tax=Cellulophaga TaxID=104264 RepID=UPI00051CCFD7|nr:MULTISPECIES: hypothetical protein [Cellulophaga]KGK30469.1 hypothetical protein EL45_09895 [Cellulophaga sp. E6(2014)]MCR1023208.1 hypothetical protein [Cellulophaga baltica]
MRNLFALFTMLLAVLSFTGCSLDETENFHFVTLPIESVEIPESFDLNETYEIKVTYLRTSDCAFFEGFDIVKEDTTIRTVAAIGSMLSDSDDCKEVLEEVETSFNFIVLYPDTYLFKFYTGEDTNGEAEYLEIEVPVNE